MNTLASIMKVTFASGLLVAGSQFINPVLAQDSQAKAEAQRQAEEAELHARREAMMADIETIRQDAERAAEEARMEAERLRREAERVRDETEAEREARRRELARMREELGRTHRELRRASQEVARAHRDLALADDQRQRAPIVNLGDRAMLGVILGNQTDEGITIVGISPDGPAERVGIQSGDVLVSLRGVDLGAKGDASPRARVFEIMSEVEDGEKLSAAVLRDGERREFTIKPEKREPASWASFIRLPAPPDAPGAQKAPNLPAAPKAPNLPAAPAVPAGRIAVPPINVAELAAEAEALAKELDSFKIRFEGAEGDPMVYEYEYQFDPDQFDFESDTQAFTELSEMALNEARFWLGNPATQGIRFAELNKGLQRYFDADRGVLVLEAPADNAFGLQSGDVVQKIGSDEVNATADVVRALRGIEAGEQFEIAIKRDRQDESLEVVMPENRLGMLQEHLLEFYEHAPVAAGSADG